MGAFDGFINNRIADHVHIQIVHHALDDLTDLRIVSEFVEDLVVTFTNSLVCEFHGLETLVKFFDLCLGLHCGGKLLRGHVHIVSALFQCIIDPVIEIFKFSMCAINTAFDRA